MFAKFRGLGRRHGPPALAKRAPCNDNRAVRRLFAISRRARRQVLACRWRVVPATGRLECFWQVVPVATAAAEKIGISWMIRRMHCPTEAFILQQQADEVVLNPGPLYHYDEYSRILPIPI